MTIKLIQVGLGAHGMSIGKEFVIPSPDFCYAGLAEVDKERLRLGSELFHVPLEYCFEDYKAASAEVEADAEKPFVLRIEEDEELVALAKSKDLKIMVSQNYRYIRHVVTLKDVIDRNILGKPMISNAQFYCFHEGKPYQREMKDYMLLEMAVHHVDLMRFIDDGNIKIVSGKTWNETGSGYIGDPHVHAVYEMDSGLPVFYLGSLYSKGLTSVWEVHWRVQCERGSIYMDDLGDGYGVYLFDESGRKEKIPMLKPEREGIHGVLAEFAGAIRQDREPFISGADNLHTIAALIATSASSQEEKPMSTASF